MLTIDGYSTTEPEEMVQLMQDEAVLFGLYSNTLVEAAPFVPSIGDLKGLATRCCAHLTSYTVADSIDTLWEGWDLYCQLRTEWNNYANRLLGSYLKKSAHDRVWKLLAPIAQEIKQHQADIAERRAAIADLRMFRLMAGAN